MSSSSSGLAPSSYFLSSCCLCLLAFFLVPATGSPSNVAQCCRRHNIPEACVDALCNPSRPPSDINVYGVFEKPHNCQVYLPRISQCLTDGRNHTHCCLTEAKDKDENSCIQICEGRSRFNDSSWTKYQTCLALNLPSMLNCFVRGYETIPSRPHSLRVSIEDAETVQVAWAQPLVNPRLAAQYIVRLKETEGHRVHERITSGTHITIGGLLSDTRYKVEVYSVTSDGKHRSLGSDIHMFQTPGQPPKVSAYRPEVRVPRREKTAIIACIAATSGSKSSVPTIQWVKKTGKKMEPVSNPRYNITMYSSGYRRPKEYVATIDIGRVSMEDAGHYRCIATNEFGSASADIVLLVHAHPLPFAHPPDSPLACCKRLQVKDECLPMCGAPQEKRAPKKNKERRPPFHNCSNDVGKVLQCAMNYHVDDGACCLRRGVPRICMYLCDNTDVKQSFTPYPCLQHMDEIEQCRVDGERKRPMAVGNLKADPENHSKENVVHWSTSDKADSYHVYFRPGPSEPWTVRTVDGTSRKIAQTNKEIAVVAANAYGSSFPVYIKQVNGRWKKL
uniref:Fibronectin type-III domain-containing protein n=1 Tax=Steinernema glaseri TaxID=37863 RepID=A0A1I7YWJ6_9BILA